METEAEIAALDGTEGTEKFMLLRDIGLVREEEWESWAAELPERIARRGWKHTHTATWKWRKVARRDGCGSRLVRSNEIIIPVQTI